jgi:heme A synthase
MPFLFSLLVLVIVLGLIYWIVTLLPIPPPFKQVALVIVIVICLIYLLGILFGAVAPFPIVRHY